MRTGGFSDQEARTADVQALTTGTYRTTEDTR